MFEIELPVADGGVSYIDDMQHSVSPYTLICAKPGQTRHTKLPFKCYYIHMIVDEGELCDKLMKIPSFVEVSDREKYEEIFKELCECYSTALFQDILLMQSLLLRLIYLLCDYTQNCELGKKFVNRDVIEEAILYIKENLSSRLSLEKISKYASFSPSHFHTSFKKATGKTLREYVEEQRIQKSIQLLLSTSLTLSEIAYECGFSSQSYFSYAFKRKMKVPPREYAVGLYKKYGERES